MARCNPPDRCLAKGFMTPNFLHQFAGQVGITIMYGVAIVAAAILATIFLAESNSGVRPPGVRKIPGRRPGR
jgi:hypothetical protein